MNPAENYILNQTEPFRTMLLRLKATIEHAIPRAQLKYKWSIPCYYLDKRPFCYLNVSVKKGYVDVGFWCGAQLSKHIDKMTTEGRKLIKSLRYHQLSDIDDKVFKEVLMEAFKVQDTKF